MVSTLLIANRGEIACRIARTARAMGIRTVAVFSDADRDAVHVAACDEAVAIGGAAPGESYLRVDALLEAAARTGADAVHPGYGFLAENAAFATACREARLCFVGPAPEVIAAMGDKLAAKARMRAQGVPVLESWDPSDVPPDAFPVLVKAAAGGGGKGMRVVHDADALPPAVAAAQREAAAAFGDDRVFVERYLGRARHVEVQVLGDEHGTLVHLGERECSIQRRHQKVIEESPSPAVDEALRAELCDAALRAARSLRYTNAGTVEFVLGDDGRFYFLEVNTRLQVEHPVTELAWQVRGHGPLDLVRLQLLVARGARLGFAQDDVVRVGHAIEARLYAEDPARGYLPSAGRLVVFEPPAWPGVRVDAGVRAGSEVPVHYDPLLAKVVVGAPTREEAAARLAAALDASRVHGVATNRAQLSATLRSPAFLRGDLHTGFLDEHATAATDPLPAFAADLHAVAAALAGARARARARRVQTTVPPGWRNNPSQPQCVEYGGVEVRYALRRDGSWQVRVGHADYDVRVHGWPDERDDGRIDLELDRRRTLVAVAAAGDDVFVDSTFGTSRFTQRPRFPSTGADGARGGLLAPLPATVALVAVAPGDTVAKGDLLLTLEAMKMEHRVTAPQAGVVRSVPVRPGTAVAAGDLLAVVEPAEEPPPA